jgi:hypothetical protein
MAKEQTAEETAPIAWTFDETAAAIRVTSRHLRGLIAKGKGQGLSGWAGASCSFQKPCRTGSRAARRLPRHERRKPPAGQRMACRDG